MAEIRGGKKFEKALADIVKKLGKPFSLKVGFMSNATYPDGTKVAEVAFYNDRGTENSPPRPFFRNAVAENSPGWSKGIALALENNDNNVDLAMNLTGQAIKEQIQQSIIDTNSPPLAESTIERKGFSKPLIETELMFDSVTFEVKS